MSGENQYISPIIDAFLRRRQQDIQTNQENVKNQVEQKRVENENKYREGLLKESEERLSNAHEEHLANLELAKQQHEIASKKSYSDLFKGLQEAVRNAQPGTSDAAATAFLKGIGGTFKPGQTGGGGGPVLAGQQLPGYTPASGTIPQIGGGQSEAIPIEGFRTPEGEIQQKGSLATVTQAPKTAAQLQVDAQKAQENHQRDVDKSVQGLANALEIHKARGDTAVQLREMADKTNMAIANAHNGTTLKHAQIMMGEDPNLSPQEAGIRAGQASNLYWGILDGTTKIKDLNKAQKMQVANFAHDIGSEVPSDSLAEIAKTYAAAGPVYKQVEDIINQYSADAPHGGRTKAKLGGKGFIGDLTGYGKDIESKEDQLSAQAALLAAQNDPKARLIGSVLATQLKGVFDPARTKKENLDNLKKIKAANQSTFDSSISGLPAEVGTALKARKGILGFEQDPTKDAPIKATPGMVPAGGVPVMKPHPKGLPNTTYNPTLSQQTGQDVWDMAPTQSPTAVPATNPMGGPQ